MNWKMLMSDGAPIKISIRHPNWRNFMIAGAALAAVGLTALVADGILFGFLLFVSAAGVFWLAQQSPNPRINDEIRAAQRLWLDSLLNSAKTRLADMSPTLSSEAIRYVFEWSSPPEPTEGVLQTVTSLTVIYAREKSILFFQYPRLVVRTSAGCSNVATLVATGDTTYKAEELFFSSIGALSTTHEELRQLVQSEGCFGAPAERVFQREGFMIRSQHETYTVNHHDTNELRSCIRNINERIQAYK